MKNKLFPGIILVVLSTLSYYAPVYFAGLDGYNLLEVPGRFYRYYCWTTSGNLFLIAVYSFYLFIFTDSRFYKTKIIFCWLFIAETYTFFNHVFNKFFAIKAYDGLELIITFGSFALCFLWFLSRAIYTDKSVVFNPENTYILKFKPKNLFGIFNYLVNLTGHSAIYQDGKIYKFQKKSGKIEPRKTSKEVIGLMIKNGSLSIKKVPKNKDIDKIIGKKYSFFRYNCNNLAREFDEKQGSSANTRP